MMEVQSVTMLLGFMLNNQAAVVQGVVWPETHARIVDDQSVMTLQGFRSNNQGTLVPGVV